MNRLRDTLGYNGLFKAEDASQEDASLILLFEAVNYKVKSTSKLLRSLERITVRFVLN